MQIFLSYTVVGLVAGCVYALIATGLVVTYNTTGIFNFAHAVIATVGIALGLRVLFSSTRTGIAMRAVVDSPDLLAMAGGRPVRIQQLAWMLSCSIAALAGILLAPIARLDILLLTLLVVDGYAAAIIGRLRNLPLAVAGAMAIGLGQFYIAGYANADWVKRVQYVIPMVVLFAVLILLPQDRLRTASFTGAVAPRVAGLKSSVIWAAVLVLGTVLVSGALSGPNLRTAANGFALALVLLSLLLLTGYGGMVSICQLT